jgi:hypothetical protein
LRLLHLDQVRRARLVGAAGGQRHPQPLPRGRRIGLGNQESVRVAESGGSESGPTALDEVEPVPALSCRVEIRA